MRQRCQGGHRLGSRKRGAIGYRSEQDRCIRGSAGGHLAASSGTISGFGSDERPNAMILFNPACTLAPIAGWKSPRAQCRAFHRTTGRRRKKTLASSSHRPTYATDSHSPWHKGYYGSLRFRGRVRERDEKGRETMQTCRLRGAGHGFFNSSAVNRCHPPKSSGVKTSQQVPPTKHLTARPKTVHLYPYLHLLEGLVMGRTVRTSQQCTHQAFDGETKNCTLYPYLHLLEGIGHGQNCSR